MKKRILLPTILILVGCSTWPKVDTSYELDYNHWKYDTFSLAPSGGNVHAASKLYQQLTDMSIRSAVIAELTARGYVQSNTQPDLTVHYQIVPDQKTNTATDVYAYRDDPYWETLPGWPYEHGEGTLVIDLMDNKGKHLIWRGWTTRSVYEKRNSEQIKERITGAVKAMFRKFPGSAPRAYSVDGTTHKNSQ
jgi:hypothetical protein